MFLKLKFNDFYQFNKSNDGKLYEYKSRIELFENSTP